jgi:predicted RNA-binding Zn-ribbon protein involved in translation (DUF1610 family)
MTKATPDQIRVFRHSRLMVILTGIGIVVAIFIVMAGLLSLKMVHQNFVAVLFVGIGTPLIGWIVGEVFTRKHFRCPICGRRIRCEVSAQNGAVLGSSCKDCDVDFAA